MINFDYCNSLLSIAAPLLTALLIAGASGPLIVQLLRRFCREPNVSDSSTLQKLHQAKDRTPTMGGMIPLGAIVMTTLLTADIHCPEVVAVLLLILGLTLLGTIDDVTKIRTGRRGLSARQKLAGQIIVATLAAGWIYWQRQQGGVPGGPLEIPLTGIRLSLGIGFIPLAVLVVTASSNAVNLTDGLDGLATGCMIVGYSALASCIWIAGSMTGVDASIFRELIPVVLATIGALIGFLRLNRYPARVFLGDTGSLPLGGLLGFAAVLTGNALLLLVLGGVFVIETLSVIIQVTSFKLRRRRVFLCAPLHHHFQFLGWSEPKIVRTFLVAAIGCAVLSVAFTAYEKSGNVNQTDSLANVAACELLLIDQRCGATGNARGQRK